jgi:DNA-binding LytR/AlgR family response regulator
MESIFNSKICFQLVGSQYVLLHQNDIICAEADKQLCRIQLVDGSKLIVGAHLGYYKKKLLESHGFIEISRSILANSHHISKYHPRERMLYLTDGITVKVAKGRQEYLNQLFRHAHERQAGSDLIDPGSI